MEFGLDKCAKATFKRGKKISAEGIQLNDNKVIQDLESETTCTYLGMEVGNGTDHHKMKAKIQKDYKRRIRLVLKSELQCQKQYRLAVPVVSYSYGMINWNWMRLKTLIGLQGSTCVSTGC